MRVISRVSDWIKWKIVLVETRMWIMRSWRCVRDRQRARHLSRFVGGERKKRRHAFVASSDGKMEKRREREAGAGWLDGNSSHFFF